MHTKKSLENPVIKYIKDFLNSSRKELMEKCYSSIRDYNNMRKFKNEIRNCKDCDFDSFFPLVSFVILTANKIECDSLNFIVSKIKDNNLQKREHMLPIFEKSDLASAEAYIFKINSFYFLHLNAYETGANTPGGSTDLVRYINKNQFLYPTCIVSFGVCYGRDPNNQNIGDVIIPKKLYPWSIGQKISENGLKIKNDNFNLWLEDKFSNSFIYSNLRDFCNAEEGRIIDSSLDLFGKCKKNETKYCFSIKVKMGNMSTGEAVISSRKVKKMLRESINNEEELGGEMEGYGLAKECIFYTKIPCFILKAICDWGEYKDIDKKLKNENMEVPNNLKDKLQSYAAFCAGIVLIRLLCEKKLLSLKIINWMGDFRRKNNRCDYYNYVKKDVVIKNIKKFYKTNNEIANVIFDKMIENKIIEPSKQSNQYHTTIQ